MDPGAEGSRTWPGSTDARRIRKRYPDDEETVEDLLEADRDSFAHHDTAAYIDITDNAEAESYCRNCAAQLGWEFRKLEGDRSLLEALLDSRVEDERLLFVPPGPSDRTG
jgi:hypothetical protein